VEIISDKINDDNKKQLVQVLLNSWNSYASAELLRGHTVTLICLGEGFEQTSCGESTFCSAVPSFRSTQEEMDSRLQSSLILYVCKRPRIQGCESKKPGHRHSFYSVHFKERAKSNRSNCC